MNQVETVSTDFNEKPEWMSDTDWKEYLDSFQKAKLDVSDLFDISDISTRDYDIELGRHQALIDCRKILRINLCYSSPNVIYKAIKNEAERVYYIDIFKLSELKELFSTIRLHNVFRVDDNSLYEYNLYEFITDPDIFNELLDENFDGINIVSQYKIDIFKRKHNLLMI